MKWHTGHATTRVQSVRRGSAHLCALAYDPVSGVIRLIQILR